jgi:ATP-dependent DNA helicase RecQ
LLLPPSGARAPASRRPSRIAPAPVAEELDSDALALFEALRQQRLDLARARGVPPYVVASDRTLREIAQLRPSSLAELLLAHGVGPAKAEQYGPGWLEVVKRASA